MINDLNEVDGGISDLLEGQVYQWWYIVEANGFPGVCVTILRTIN